MKDLTDSIHNKTFEEYVSTLNLARARFGYWLIIVMLPLGVVLDFMMYPDYVRTFFGIRVLGSCAAASFLWLSYLSKFWRKDFIMNFLPAATAVFSLEAMMVVLREPESPYYAGLILIVIGIGTWYTWRWKQALIATILTIGSWLIPAIPLVLEHRVNTGLFFNNLYFLSVAALISAVSVEIRYQAVKREFHARIALAETSQELSSALSKAKELDRIKSEFFANISHELRTPLTLILSPVDELIRQSQDPLASESLMIVRRNAARLLRLIDDLLDLARMEAGTLRLRVRTLDLVELAKRVFDNIRPAANARGIIVDFQATPNAIEVHGDEHRLEIVITNLLSNALKFTPRAGTIKTRVSLEESGAVITVDDTGPGIPLQAQERIFDRFYQVHGSERRRYGGTGLGLALAREIAQLHGGSINVLSQPGAGATFRFAMPTGQEHFRPEIIDRRQRQMSEHPKRRAEDLAVDFTPTKTPILGSIMTSLQQNEFERPIVLDRGRRARMVIVEDEDDLRQFIVNVLAPQFDVSAAADGKSALALIKDERPDLVLSDIMMPDMSGYDLCRAIKADDQLKRVIVILLTARGETETAIEGFAAGADDFVPKPFHPQTLIARIRAHLQNQALNLQLADHARLSTAGTLAAGLAHEIRNPINAVVNAAKVLQSGGSIKVSTEKLISIIMEGVNRINSVVSSLDTHARPADGMEAMTCKVEESIEATLVLLSHRINDVAIHKKFEKDHMICAPARAFNQVLLNLVDNSLRSGASEIWIGSQEEKGFVKIFVEDNGPGVPSHITERIFDPFFTTRPTGTGTGLGLHLSRKLARDVGGDLYYEPRPGGGARFIMQVPSMEKAA